MKFSDFFGDEEVGDWGGEGEEKNEEDEDEDEDEDEEGKDGTRKAKRGGESRLFIAAEGFQGSKEGYVFKMGNKGLGYYFDGPEEEEEEEQQQQPKTKHERDLLDLSRDIEKLEEGIAAEREWLYQGEASASKRPANSLLEVRQGEWR
eukprot:746822-Hanusia_phi.AAC.1